MKKHLGEGAATTRAGSPVLQTKLDNRRPVLNAGPLRGSPSPWPCPQSLVLQGQPGAPPQQRETTACVQHEPPSTTALEAGQQLGTGTRNSGHIQSTLTSHGHTSLLSNPNPERILLANSDGHCGPSPGKREPRERRWGLESPRHEA